MIRVSHDYLDPTFISDPYPYFKKIREEMPVHWNERWRGWIVTRYDDVYGALHNDNLLADTITPYFQALKPEDQEKFALTYDVLNSWTVFLDPPKHTRLRRICSGRLRPAPSRRCARWWNRSSWSNSRAGNPRSKSTSSTTSPTRSQPT